MYATIEPRLIALLNDGASEFPVSPSLELPPLQDPNILKASGRPLLLEPDASTRSGKAASSSNSQHTSSIPALIEDDDKSHSDMAQNLAPTSKRALGISSPQSLRKILGDDVGPTTETTSSKKRLIVEANKDDFVQLPQPPKKQKTAKQVVPPIIIGLFEPPPQAALFPPIASSSFHDSHGRNTLNTIPISLNGVGDITKNPSIPKSKETSVPQKSRKKKDVKARKKWTEHETNSLLLGVHKHGVGYWTDILEDAAFDFNERSAADLKDRFRTCCPAELRGDNPKNHAATHEPVDYSKKAAPRRSKSGLLSENILIHDDDAAENSNDTVAAKPKKSRTHRKKLEDLFELGIEAPFRKSHRRERRAFTIEEDREILYGYQVHGSAWTKIQRDPQFHLQSRKPTDLRDRFRNKYPDKFRAEDKSQATLQQASHPEDLTSSHLAQGTEKQQSRTMSTKAAPHLTLPSLVEKQSHERGVEGCGKTISQRDSVLGPRSLSNHPSSIRDGLRIEQILSSDQQSTKPMPPQPQAHVSGPKDGFISFTEAPTIEATDNLPFSQSFDWVPSITAPFTTSMGEMDISRLLLDESWIENPSTSGQEKHNMTELNNIVHSADLPNGPSFYNLLCDPEDLHEPSFG